MSEQNPIQEHWQAIAAQLGLTIEPEPPSSTPPPPPPRPVPPAEPAAAPEPAKTEDRGTSDLIRAESADQGVTFQSSEITPPTEAESTESAPVAEETAPELLRDEPRSGKMRRRRGRRSGRGSEKRQNADVATPEISESETAAEDAEDTRRRDRRKPREEEREDEEVAATEEDDEVVESRERVAEEEDSDLDEEVDTLSNWNVPSWQELIASLYRPER